jgi:hypothetical protein
MTFQNAGTVAAQTIDRWSWWRHAVKNPEHIGKTLLASPSDPELGYYRCRGRDKQWEPVGIFLDDDGQMVAERGLTRRRVDPLDVWTSCLRYPVTYEFHVKALRGEGYDDEPPPPIGDNSGAADPLGNIKLELEGEKETAETFLEQPIASQADADRIGIWAKRFLDIGKRAETERVTEKEPHLEAGRAVDAKWKPLVDEAKAFADRLRKHVEPWLLAEKRKALAAANAAREEAQRQRREAETAETDEARQQALQAAKQAADEAVNVRNASAGRTGARVSVRVEKRANITDFEACLMALKDHPDLRVLVQQLAQRAVKAGVPLAGVEVEEVEKIV